MRNPWKRLLLLAIAAAVSAACKDTRIHVDSIKTLLDDPARFDHQPVRVAGDVTRSLGILGYGAYELDDGTGQIPIVTGQNGAPRSGARVGVEGEFRQGFTLGSSSVAAIVEKRRYTPPGSR